MADIKELDLTRDPLENISIMVPMLNGQSRSAVAYFMYGCYVGESIVRDSKRDNHLQEVLQE